jgi:hypothetical protein
MKIFVQCKHFKDGEHLSTSCGFYDSLNMTFEDKLCLKDYEVSIKDDTIIVKMILRSLKMIPRSLKVTPQVVTIAMSEKNGY